MTWAEAVQAMKRGRWVRRPHWAKHDIIRFTDDHVFFPDKSERRSVLFIEENKSINFDFILNDVCADDWVLSPLMRNEDDTKWIIVP